MIMITSTTFEIILQLKYTLRVTDKKKTLMFLYGPGKNCFKGMAV